MSIGWAPGAQEAHEQSQANMAALQYEEYIRERDFKIQPIVELLKIQNKLLEQILNKKDK